MARIGLVLAGISAFAVLTACGGNDFADESADTIVKESKGDMGDLEAVKVAGEITSDGQAISIDLQANSSGDCTGSLGIADGKAELLGVDGDTWMKPDEAFWRSFAGTSADQIISIVGDKWVVVPDGEDSINQFCDVNDLLDNLLKEDTSDGSTYTKKGTDTVDGDDVVKVDNEDPKDGTSTGYVLVDDPHYLVKIEKTDGADTGSVTFSEFDEEFEVTAPGTDEVIDLDNLSS
ncbi:MAG TPA: hypothetical protein VFT70_13145 [Nocardioides sp.]|nr:hypothetical protein [Nocardioides sp.]